MLKTLYYAGMSAVARAERRHTIGTNIFENDEWDVCIVLDSCRYDMLSNAVQENVTGVWSVGSVTTEWLANTFHEDRVPNAHKLGLVSATPHTTTVFRDRNYLTNPGAAPWRYPEPAVIAPEDFAGFHEVWRSHASELDAVPPNVMRDATLEAHDRHDRVVAHWLQPHEPFIAPHTQYHGGSPTGENVWTELEQGVVDEQTVWRAYNNNLNWALTYLKETIDAIDGTVLVTADHGNAFGRWGVYGHPFGWPAKNVRKVPWLLIEGKNEPREYERVLDADGTTADVDAQLRALGYR